MEVEGVMSRLEQRVDKWIGEFEDRPISMGIRVVLLVILIRWIWRAFK